MKLRHKSPCAECPWKTDSLKGYLGGQSAMMYADAVAENEIPACHLSDFGPDDKRSSMCAGALSTAANACIQPHKTKGAIQAVKEVGPSDKCFQHPAFFYKYHTGEQWKMRILREQEKKSRHGANFSFGTRGLK